MVLKAVLMRSGLVSLTTARPVNTAQLITIVNSARPMTNVFNKTHSTVRRPINNKTATKNSNFNQRVNTVKDKNINIVRPKAVVNTARPKAVLNDIQGKQVNVVKASACWVWKPKTKVIDHVSKDNSASIILKKFDYVDAQGRSNHGCSRHMTGNMSYLTDFEEIDGGYAAFGADSKLPTTFWVEAVNTSCYVQNRILVTKPHNKTPYELFLGRKPALSFMRPFGCPVTILNTIDHLDKFDGKADEGFFVGYSIKSKAFRVFNSRTRIVKENLHVQFSENTPNISGSGPNWLFDIDALTNSMNYKPVVAGNQSNDNTGTKACDDADKGSTPSCDDGKMVDEDSRKDREGIDHQKDDNVNSTNNVNVASTNKLNAVGGKISIELPYDLNMLALEDIIYSDDDEEADMNNLDAFMPVSPIPTTRVHKDHLVDQIIRDLNSTPQTRRMIKNLEEHGRTQKGNLCIKGSKLDRGYAGRASTIQVTRSLDFGGMDVKSAFLYGKIEEEVYDCQPPGFEDPDFPDRVYKVEKALYGLHQTPRAWYETLSTYLLDNGFQRGKIDKNFFIRRDKGLQVKQKEDGIFISQDKYMTEILKKFGFIDVKTASTPIETQKPLLKDEDGEKVDVHLYRSMIGSLMYLTSSRPDIMFAVCACARYQVNPKVSHLHAVKRIFSDYAGASLDRKSTTGGFQFLRCRLISWQCKKQSVVANSTTKAEYVATSSCLAKDSNEKKLIQMIKIHTDKNVANLLTKAFDNKSLQETKMEDDKETDELQSMMEVIPDEEEVAVDAIPLATKPPSIVDWKIIKEGKISYYQYKE
ncbi:putative ribonuclease H-like domain-containing protein [Tanacetum coccineum]